MSADGIELPDQLVHDVDHGVPVRIGSTLRVEEATPRPGGLISMQIGTYTESVLGRNLRRRRALIQVKGGQACIAHSRQECGAGTGWILDPGERLEITHRGQVFARSLLASTPGVRNPSPANATVLVGTVPAAGAQWSVTVPSGESWELRTVRATLATSATVASRQASLTITSPLGATFFRNTVSPSATASVSWGITWSSIGTDANNRSGEVEAVLPDELMLPAGTVIASVFNSGFQVDDQWSAPILSYFRYADTFTTVNILSEGY